MKDSKFDGKIPNGISVLKFTADWCSSCKSLKPKFLSVANKLKLSFLHNKDGPDVNFFEVDVDKFMDFAVSQGVKSVPAIGVFNNGNVVGWIKGDREEFSLEMELKGMLK